MKRETLILSFDEFSAFWVGVVAGNNAIEAVIDGDLGMVFLIGVPA